MKILISGGSGFIGTHVIEKLLEGNHSLQALSRSANQLESARQAGDIQWISSSLLLDETTKKFIADFNPEVLIHLAWEKIPDFSFETSFENLQNHILFFRNIFTVNSLKKIIVTGSCWEYNKKIGGCKESDICISSNYFNWSKNSLRDFLQFECSQKNIIFAWARVFYIFGPKQRMGSLIPSIINSLKNNNIPDIRKPFNANDFIYVDDVAEGFRQLVDNDFVSGVYNFGSGKSTSIIDILRMVEQQLLNSEKITESVLDNSEGSLKEVDFWADMHKTSSMLKWGPSVTLEDGIQKMINSLQ